MYQLSLLEKNFGNFIRNFEEPSWVKQYRLEAFKSYKSLPLESSALYSKYSNANKLHAEKVFFNDTNLEDESSHDLDIFSDRIDEFNKTTSVLCKNSKILESFVMDDLKKKGIVILNISQALREYSDLIQKYLNKNKANYQEDKFLALSSAAFQNGLFILIPKNIVLEDPIRIVNYLSEDGFSSISKNIIVCEEFSKATLVQELYSPRLKKPEYQQTHFELLESYVLPNAQCEIVTLQSMDYDAISFSNRKAYVERDGKMSWSLALFGSQLSRYKVDSIMQGPGALAEDVEIIFGVGNQSFDITSNLIHVAPNTRGKVLVKSVMKDTSQSLFKGMIKILTNAKATESYLAGHAILLDKGAKSDAIPGLEIESNEVKATHSASVAQIDEKQIFYLMSRGLSEELAKREIVGGFLEPISRKMGPTIRAWINYLIENKWLGKPLKLKIDEAMEQILEIEKTRYRETEDIFEKHYKYR
jgi:Fe-S cluster assembly scaffold protein SufB